VSQPRRPFTPTPAYKLFLQGLIQTRIDRGYTVEQLAELIGLSPAQVASFEAGEHPLGFIDVRNWLLALDMPFTQFTQQMEEVLDSSPERDEGIVYPDDFDPKDVEIDEAEPDSHARAAPLAHQMPTIQVLFFAPGALPEVRTIQNTLEAKQALVEGLITTFETGVEGTIGVANDEALLEGMPLNRQIPTNDGYIFGPFLVAGDVDGGFRSLSPLEVERVLDGLCPELSQEQLQGIVRTLDGGPEWIEMWN
jgi:transcriptional regulator with XRE-family HTH domain